MAPLVLLVDADCILCLFALRSGVTIPAAMVSELPLPLSLSCSLFPHDRGPRLPTTIIPTAAPFSTSRTLLVRSSDSFFSSDGTSAVQASRSVELLPCSPRLWWAIPLPATPPFDTTLKTRARRVGVFWSFFISCQMAAGEIQSICSRHKVVLQMLPRGKPRNPKNPVSIDNNTKLESSASASSGLNPTAICCA
jgi:hypothetical protein